MVGRVFVLRPLNVLSTRDALGDHAIFNRPAVDITDTTTKKLIQFSIELYFICSLHKNTVQFHIVTLLFFACMHGPLSMFNCNQCYYNIYQRNEQRHRQKLKLSADTAENKTKHTRNAMLTNKNKNLCFRFRFCAARVYIFAIYFGVFNLKLHAIIREHGVFFLLLFSTATNLWRTIKKRHKQKLGSHIILQPAHRIREKQTNQSRFFCVAWNVATTQMNHAL